MSKFYTAKSWPFGRAPARIELLGERRRPEAAEHIIWFPGGAIEIARASDDEYWAHVIINRGWAHPSMTDLSARRGLVVASRLQLGTDLVDIPRAAEAAQIAVLIRTEEP